MAADAPATEWAAPAPPTRDEIRATIRRGRLASRWKFAALLASMAAVAIGGVLVGPMRVAPAEAAALAMEKIGGPTAAVDAATRTVVEQIRLPRVALGLLIGAALAICGAAMQGLFRNPLADPALIGISASAACGAVAVIVLGHRFFPMPPPWLAPHLLALMAFVGAFAATLLIYRLSLHDGHPVVATMLLAGVAINALASALTAFLIFLANDQQVRDVTFWMLGSLGAATWTKVLIVAPGVALGVCALPFLARALNALLLGDAEAGHLGFDVVRTKWIVIMLSTLMVGTAVAFAGVIGFVGLVAPHAIRLAAGPDHRFLLPASAILGGTLLVAADLVARTVAAPAELPIGVLTAILGAPFFLWLLLRVKAAWQP